MRSLSRAYSAKGKTIAFVPTMGALHRGHISLIDIAKKKADIVIVSIFVNPLQFAPHEDFDQYPRDEEGDLKKCEMAGTDIVFVPSYQDINSKPDSFQINVGHLGAVLDGVTRPHFFGGVATVVAKLFNIVEPDIAVFGQKDLQQSLIIKKLVNDLNYCIQIVVAPIIREPNGLAMSSRNKYLSDADKEEAGVIFGSLQEGAKAIGKGELDRKIINAVMINHIRKNSKLKIDYVQSVSVHDLSTPDIFLPGEKIALLVAAFSGKTRLIDNTIAKSGFTDNDIYISKNFKELGDVL
jgi:pantoate--beta-alanine ligase